MYVYVCVPTSIHKSLLTDMFKIRNVVFHLSAYFCVGLFLLFCWEIHLCCCPGLLDTYDIKHSSLSQNCKFKMEKWQKGNRGQNCIMQERAVKPLTGFSFVIFLGYYGRCKGTLHFSGSAQGGRPLERLGEETLKGRE